MSQRFAEQFRCTARNQAGRRCGRASIPGGHVCRMHGGAAPQVRAAAERRLQVEQAWKAVARLTAERRRPRSWGEVAADALDG